MKNSIYILVILTGTCVVGLDADAVVLFKDPISGYVRPFSPTIINLGDYAKGDGTDETLAIQRAFDAIPPVNPNLQGYCVDHPGAILYIPRPKNFYGISSTITIAERWNTSIICETVGYGTRVPATNIYFRWIGPDNSVMFNFNQCKGMRVENLSLCGMDQAVWNRYISGGGTPPTQRLTNGVTGIVLGPISSAVGFTNNITFDRLTIKDVNTCIKLGDYANNGPDVTNFSFRNAWFGEFSQYGVYACSGNLANTTFETVTVRGGPGAKAGFMIMAGEVLILNLDGHCVDVDSDSALIMIDTGGLHVTKAWSEWGGPFLKAINPQNPETEYQPSGAHNYPIVLESVRHYNGFWSTDSANNPVPVSIAYDRPAPLHLIGCHLWGEVSLGSISQSTIIDHGTIFLNKDCAGFTGEGVTKYRRLVSIGTRNAQNARILDPYVIDRRNVPGIGSPSSGYWNRGDGIVNIEPDPAVPAKAWRGWICIQSGEPGQWAPYGALGSVLP
jgi:hypothetical protein